MDLQIKVLRKIWQGGFALLAVLVMIFSGLIMNLTGVIAQGTPSLFVTHLGVNNSQASSDWSHNPSGASGDFVQLSAEVGTHVSTPAENVNVKFQLPGGFGNSGTSSVVASSTTANVSERTDSVTWNFQGPCKLVYDNGSATARVDRDRDGVAEIDGAISDDIVGSGVNFGTFTNGLVQISLTARIVCEGAAGAPNLTVNHLGTNISETPSEDWSHSVTADNGDFVQLYTEASTNIATPAENVTVKFQLPTTLGTSGTSTVVASSSTSGVSQQTDSVNWNYRGVSCRLAYVAGSASARVDRNRDGTNEHDGPITDSIVTSGVNFGTFTNGIVYVTFKARVECEAQASPTPSPTPSPSPSPSPSPTPTPTPPAGGNNNQNDNGNNNNNSNNNNNDNSNEVNVNVNNNQTQTVNVTQPAVSGLTTVAGIPLKQPDTGVSVLGMAVMAGAAPLGLFLARYGRGTVAGKIEEDLSQLAGRVFKARKGKKLKV